MKEEHYQITEKGKEILELNHSLESDALYYARFEILLKIIVGKLVDIKYLLKDLLQEAQNDIR